MNEFYTCTFGESSLLYFQIFGFKQIAEHAELPDAFMIGAGAGPAHVIGVNSEVLY